MTRPLCPPGRISTDEGISVWLEATGQGHFVRGDHVRFSRIRTVGGAKATTCSLLTGEKHSRLSMARALRITSLGARGILGTILFHTPYMGLQSKVRNLRAAVRPYIVFIWTRSIAIYESLEGND